MATKPTIALARFATGPGQDVTAPSSGLRDTGFVEGTPADQSYINELFNQSYQWALYLDEGDLVGDHEIDGNLAVTGDVLVGDDLTVTDDAAIGGDLAVTGLITATAGVTCAANQHVTVSGTGEVKHGDRILPINALIGISDGGWAPSAGGNQTSSAAGVLYVNVPLIAGDRIKSVRFKIFGNGSADLVTTVKAVSSAMVTSDIGTDTTNNQAASWGTVTIDVTDTTQADLTSIFIQFEASALGVRVGNISVTYDHP